MSDYEASWDHAEDRRFRLLISATCGALTTTAYSGWAFSQGRPVLHKIPRVFVLSGLLMYSGLTTNMFIYRMAPSLPRFARHTLAGGLAGAAGGAMMSGRYGLFHGGMRIATGAACFSLISSQFLEDWQYNIEVYTNENLMRPTPAQNAQKALETEEENRKLASAILGFAQFREVSPEEAAEKEGTKLSLTRPPPEK